MKNNISYNTKQKDIIMKCIKKQNKDFTVKDIYSQISSKTGLTTIYRVIQKLDECGLVTKRIGRDNITYYRYLGYCDKKNHFYLRCDECGFMDHIDCDCIEDLSNHIIQNHNFRLSTKNIIISGICNKCYKGE